MTIYDTNCRYDDKQKATLELLVNEANHRKSGA